MTLHAVMITLHILAAIIWVGGMFFAYTSLRPAASSLETPDRLLLWLRTFEQFFRWVWTAIVVLLITGFWMIFRSFGGFAQAGTYIHLMLGIGIFMMLIFGHVYFALYKRFRALTIGGNHADAALTLGKIRKLVGFNLCLGILVTIIASTGPYF